MNLADVAILMSVIFTLIPLVNAIAAKIFADKTIYGEIETAVWLGLMVAAMLINDDNLWRSLIFGGISGFLIQPLTDLYLTKKTLVYPDREYSFRDSGTPVWMASLWGIAITQLSYLWTRLDVIMKFLDIPADEHVKWFLFITVGFLYFFIFEFAVSNYTDWWKRKHCKKIWGIGRYALCAEFFTVALLPIYFQADSFIKFTYGIFVMIVFMTCCMAAYDPKID